VRSHWYQRDQLPIGAYKGSGLPRYAGDTLSYVEDVPRALATRTHACYSETSTRLRADPNPHPLIPRVSRRQVVKNFPSRVRNSSQVPDAVSVYRRALSAAPPRSVSISSVGLLTNLEGLLKSRPDGISPLSGVDLVAAKVSLVAVMAGKYPRSRSPWAECNACGCYNGADARAKATSAAASSCAPPPPPHRIPRSR
jgi:hypothetical protein